ncbi:glycosyltransferase family 4 protein [Novosphingobium decolorationis]|uniref:Glycosyltransferase family 4 protein n=1 Tax=Novosphingobium decolorationis TaxID=2698673 RepID=A0ABX8E2L2_9SPHN|nr:glycosyltransferase family 4 protein [Novosphingobium decolorationis]QVM83125.1 glycosyltransferase family 4 protein [Novosphingobium decolorationis]
MKVLVLSSLAYSLTNFRGALLRELVANGHKVVAVAPDRNDAVERELDASGIGFRQVAMERTGTNFLRDLGLLFEYVRLMLRERPDLVLAYTQKPIIYGGIAARLLCVPRFYALMSGLGHVFSEDSHARVGLRKLVSVLYREAVRRARAIFVFNRDDRADMIRFGIVTPRHNVIQVPGSGIDLERFVEAPLPRQALRFLLIGRLMRDKGVYEFLEAAARIKADHGDCEFWVLGHYERNNPTGIDEEECARLARQYPVTFIPGCTDVRPYLEASSVFVLPSFYREGLPRTILEAMATGRAVITTDMPGCREPIVDGENGYLVEPRDAEALRAAMMRFVEEPERAATMGARARDLAEKVYDVRKVNHQLLEEMDLLQAPWRAEPEEADARQGISKAASAGLPAGPVPVRADADTVSEPRKVAH